MKATIKNLNANRETIIETLKSIFDEDSLVSKMNILKTNVEFAEMFEAREIETIIEEMIIDTPPRRKVSKTAELLAELAFNRGEVWDNKTQSFTKF